MSAAVATPLMQQYREIKARHQNAILFFRMGDFYEMFYDDAEIASRVLGLTLTSRNNGGAAEVPLAGVPVKAATDYLRRLVQQGYPCRDLRAGRRSEGRQGHRAPRGGGDGHAGRRVRRRPARRRAQQLHLRDRHRGRGDGRSTDRASRRPTSPPASCDCRSCRCEELDAAAGAPRAARAARRRAAADACRAPRHSTEALVTEREAWEFDDALAREELARQFGVRVARRPRHRAHAMRRRSARRGRCSATCASCSRAACRTSRGRRSSVPGGAMPLDEMTRRNLELVESLRGGTTTEGTLLARARPHADADGRALLRQWLLAPLVERAAIDARLDAVEALVARRRSRATRCATRSTACATRASRRQGRGRSRARRASCARWATRWRGCPTSSARVEPSGDGGLLARMRSTRWDACAEIARRRSLDTLVRAAAGRSSVTRRRSRPASTRSSTSCARSATAARTPSRGSRPRSASAPGSRRSRSATTRCSGTTSRSRTRTGISCRRTTSDARRSPAASAT